MKLDEGQLNFFDLISEYTDEQGAHVRVRKPARGKTRPVEESAEITIKDAAPKKARTPQTTPEVVTQEPIVASTPEIEKKPDKLEKPAKAEHNSEMLFKQCKKCWCFDCKHNSRNEGVPREMCGNMIPCPACKGCMDEDQATICEIGNAKEGCRLRAVEEGILIPESM